MKNIKEIDQDTIEGRMLMAALAKITTESQTDKTPDEVVKQVMRLQRKMFKSAKTQIISRCCGGEALKRKKPHNGNYPFCDYYCSKCEVPCGIIRPKCQTCGREKKKDIWV